MKTVISATLIVIITSLNSSSDAKSLKEDTQQNNNKNQLGVNLKAIKLAPSHRYPYIDNWWSKGYTGKKGVLGIIDEGVDPTHPALKGKTIIFRKEEGALYHKFLVWRVFMQVKTNNIKELPMMSPSLFPDPQEKRLLTLIVF